MARYAVGDVQGCYDALRRLLDKVEFDPASDQIWLAGDLVNRGPASLEVLRFVRGLGEAAVAVLGNHDLHLLATAMGARPAHPRDTLDEIFESADREELLNWVQNRPLLHHDGGFLLVHAGLPPQWDVRQALAYAAEVEQALKGPNARAYFDAMYGDGPNLWDASLSGPTRWRVITNYLTRMRVCNAEGRLDMKYKGGLTGAPAGYLPWFSHPHRRTRETPILFGHWAALNGKTNKAENVFALDTGCVWGGRLRMMRLEDRKLFHCKCG